MCPIPDVFFCVSSGDVKVRYEFSLDARILEGTPRFPIATKMCGNSVIPAASLKRSVTSLKVFGINAIFGISNCVLRIFKQRSRKFLTGPSNLW